MKLARFVLEQLVDDRAFARAPRLEEGNLSLRLEHDYLAQIVACDRGIANEVRRFPP
ncbi:hypothetical protein [Sphingomonas sp. M1-B02]|uniref:hypothetical protein n=1 Tax=Sphingomonas sp. M1-B02 TaxID=3114300 RepID=UPI00223FDECB|nr:hypothetical protein [Sphingomonas sp. S6-11]UZK68028.1 hypothetical protein OKW87_08405 [Sphingomonas sp. S6-11]